MEARFSNAGRTNNMKTLNAKDIEKLENTSVASAAMAATVGGLAGGFHMACDGPSCEVDSSCNITCVGVSCVVTNLPDVTGRTCGADVATTSFVSLLRQALR